MALIYNCNEDVAVAAFISGLQVTHSFYKHLVKYEVTKIRDILFQVQKYIQIEDAIRSAANRSLKKGGKGVKSKHNLLHQRRAIIELSTPSTRSPLKTRQRPMEKKRSLHHSKPPLTTFSAPSKTNLG